MADSFLVQAATYLGAAVVSVPIAKKLGLGSVLGYLVAGVVVGPSLLSLVSGGEDVLHVAEFGVVMMLFLVGLELQPSKLWQMRGSVFGLGTIQVVGTAAVVAMAAMALGLSWQVAVAIGLITSMSSTAIVLQALNEKGLMKSHVGETSFAILLFQDLAVIPILAILPLLAAPGAEAAGDHAPTLFDQLPAWAAGLVLISAVGAIILGGRVVMRPLFMFLAGTRMREIFTATALLLVAGAALLMQAVGLSPALGAFLAGVVLADSEFRHEIETDIDPFKGLLLGLFFISVGAGIDLPLVISQPLALAAIVVAIVAAKIVVLYLVSRSAKMAKRDALLTAFALSQIGEFAFVLISFASQSRILEGSLAGLLTAATALSMLTTPVLLIAFDLLATGKETVDDREADVIEERNRVIIAGFGRVGQIAGRVLLSRGIPVTVLEHDAETLETLRKFGFKLYYGDARRHDLLHAAGAEEAHLLIVATDDKETTAEIVEMARRNFPHLKVIARAYDRGHAYDLEKAGAHGVVRETFTGSVELGTEALKLLGIPAYEAERTGRVFRRHDLETFAAVRAIRNQTGGINADYAAAVRKRSQMLASVLQRDNLRAPTTDELGWDSDALREEMRARLNQAGTEKAAEAPRS